MKRLDFLAILPSLGALPFLAKNIVQENNAIIIEHPKAIEVVQEIPKNMDFGHGNDHVQFLLVVNGQVVGTAGNMQIGMSGGQIREMDLQCYTDRFTRPLLSVKCEFNQEEVIQAFFNARKYGH